MGVLADYFVASSLELAGADLSAGPSSLGWPYVDCKGWIVELADLAAELTGRDPSEFAASVLLSGGDEGPWLTRESAEVVLALAGVSDQRLAELAEEELLYDYEVDRHVGLRDLARSARDSGRDLYRWLSL